MRRCLSCVAVLALACSAEPTPSSDGTATNAIGESSAPETSAEPTGSTTAVTPPASESSTSATPTPTPGTPPVNPPPVSSSPAPTSDDETPTSTTTPDSSASDDASTSQAPAPVTSENTTEVSVEPSTGEPTEEALTAVPTARGEHGVGLLNGEVYVMGGFTPTVTSAVQVYSPATDSWRDAADFPVVFHHPNVATVGDKLYVLGFHAGSGQRKGDGSSYAYDAKTDAWTEVASMPPSTERGAACVTTYQGKVYLFGGTNDVALPDASTYDPATDQWDTLPLLPANRHHCVAAALNDKIYIVSGRDVIIEQVQAESYIYDPATQKYQEVAPILTPRGGAAGALLGGKIYVFGGEGNVDDPNGIFHETEVYDPATDKWESLPDMTVPRHGFGAVVIDGKIHLPAGSKSRGIDVVNTHSVFYLR